ncbi:hypothetical protein [Methylomonas sp. LL1]|nr:hypothetical protein [Methylomonas sp. LL1]
MSLVALVNVGDGKSLLSGGNPGDLAPIILAILGAQHYSSAMMDRFLSGQ